MKYTGLLAAALALFCTLCACETQDPNTPQETTQEYSSTATQTGSQYDSSWVTGISKADACTNQAVADWITLCSQPERDDIGHYVLHNKVENSDGTTTHHLLLYRSATEKDAKDFTVDFAMNGEMLTVTPTYTSSDTSVYGYDLIYLTMTTQGNPEISVEMPVDGDYPGAIQTTTASAITPDTFGAQANE